MVGGTGGSSAGVTVSTFNLLCPAYRRMPGELDGVRECQFPQSYRARNEAILQLPLWATSDIICCQEFWYSCAEVFSLYVQKLGPDYRMHGLQRPGPDGVTRRPDGLFMAIHNEWHVLHEADIDFEDAAGRCAQLLHLRRPAGRGRAAEELIVCNVHLLFPHNEASAQIRVREVHKLLTYLDGYKASLDAPPPALICGDFNGEPTSTVAQFLYRYGWRSSFSQARGGPAAGSLDAVEAAAAATAAAAAAEAGEAARGEAGRKADATAAAAGAEAGGRRWVSHFTHEHEALGVDYIWLLNPSEPRPAVPDWTDHAFSEIAIELAHRGFDRPSDAWGLFGGLADVQGGIDVDDFTAALKELGFGAGDASSATLTPAEVGMLVTSCDADGDGCVDSRDWCERFGAALLRLSDEADRVRDRPSAEADLDVAAARLTPRCLEDGVWPAPGAWGLSDHGVLTSTFVPRA